MARNRRYNYEPQVVDPGMIDFGSIQMYNPDDVTRLAQAGQNMQQRWDASQSVIAKQLEDIGAANINPRYKAEVVGKLEEDLDNIYSNVNTTYQGDFGRAYNDIIKSLGKSRALLHSATQATAEEAKQRDIYNQMAAAGKAPVIYKRDAKGNPTPTIMTFDEYHGIDKQPSFVEGRFNAPTFNTLRSAGEYEPYIERMVGHLMKQSSEQGLSKDPKYDAFLRQIKTIGQDPVALRKLFDTNQPEAQAMVEDFVRNNPTVTQEFVDESGKLDINLAKDFLADALVTRVKKSTDYQYMQDPDYIDRKRKEQDVPSPGVLSGVGLAKSNTFTKEDFYTSSPNARNNFFSMQGGSPLKNITYGKKEYGEGKITINQYRAAELERYIRNNSPYMEKLFSIGSKSSEQLIKEAGFNSVKEYNNLLYSMSGGLKDPRMQKFNILESERNEAANTYSNELETRASEVIAAGGWDTSNQFQYFQPSYTNAKDVSQFETFEKSFVNKATTPDQFTFLNGELRGKSDKEVAKAYKTSEGKDIPFGMPSVGGDESIGLVWEVVNPDGSKSDAKWNTGYKKQFNAIVNVYNMPELVKALNADVIKIKDNGSVSIDDRFPDAPSEVFKGLELLNAQGGIKTYPSMDNPDKVILQLPGGQYIVERETSTGESYIDYTDIESSATPITKSTIFSILALYGGAEQ